MAGAARAEAAKQGADLIVFFGANTPNRDFTARLARIGQWLRENF